jgi:hypothetical protein
VHHGEAVGAGVVAVAGEVDDALGAGPTLTGASGVSYSGGGPIGATCDAPPHAASDADVTATSDATNSRDPTKRAGAIRMKHSKSAR